MAKALFNNEQEIRAALEQRGEDVIIEIFDAIVKGRPVDEDMIPALRLGFASVMPFKGITRHLGAEENNFAEQYLKLIAFNASLTGTDLEVDGDVNKVNLGVPDDNVPLYYAACDVFAAMLMEEGEGDGETVESMSAICAMVPLCHYYNDSVIEKTLTELVRRAFPKEDEELCHDCTTH